MCCSILCLRIFRCEIVCFKLTNSMFHLVLFFGISSAIRKRFGSFFLGGKDGRPDPLKPFNIKNRVTAETKTRIDLLKLLAAKYRASNPEGRAQVISFDPRPMIKITPPPSSQDRRVKTYNYVEAVRKLPCNFTSAEVNPILRRINPELAGQVCFLT